MMVCIMLTTNQQYEQAWEDYCASLDARSERFHRELQDIKNENDIHNDHIMEWQRAHEMGLLGRDDDLDEYYAYWDRFCKWVEQQPTD